MWYIYIRREYKHTTFHVITYRAYYTKQYKGINILDKNKVVNEL